jgi:hypothetical protein
LTLSTKLCHARSRSVGVLGILLTSCGRLTPRAEKPHASTWVTHAVASHGAPSASAALPPASPSACGPARAIVVGTIAGQAYWVGDVLVDYRAKRAWQGSTLAPHPMVPSTPAEDHPKWIVSSAPDEMEIEITDPATKKRVHTPEALSAIFGNLAIDVKGRVYDLAAKRYLDSEPLSCHPTEFSYYRFSKTGRFITCSAHGMGLAVRDRATRVVAGLGDGELELAPNDTNGLLLPGPLDGLWGHIETNRKAIDKVTFDSTGRATIVPLGGESASASLTAYAVVAKNVATFHRACDDAVIGSAPGVTEVRFDDTGALAAATSETSTTVLRLE